jgi:hypothetical protein
MRIDQSNGLLEVIDIVAMRRPGDSRIYIEKPWYRVVDGEKKMKTNVTMEEKSWREMRHVDWDVRCEESRSALVAVEEGRSDL